MKTGLSNKEWIEHNFDKYLCFNYRNTVLHSSIIEAITILASEKITPLTQKEQKTYRSFREAIKILKGEHKNEEVIKLEVKQIDDCRNMRNILMHEIIKNKYTQDEIDKGIMRKLHKKIVEVYNSAYFNKIFKEEGYDFSPREKIKIFLK